MPDLPKVKIKRSFEPPFEQICDLAQAKELVFSYKLPVLVFMDDRLVRSHDELVGIAKQDNREFLELQLFLAPTGGG